MFDHVLKKTIESLILIFHYHSNVRQPTRFGDGDIKTRFMIRLKYAKLKGIRCFNNLESGLSHLLILRNKIHIVSLLVFFFILLAANEQAAEQAAVV